MEKFEELNMGIPSVFQVNDMSFEPCLVMSCLYKADVVTSATVLQLVLISKFLLVKCE